MSAYIENRVWISRQNRYFFSSSIFLPDLTNPKVIVLPIRESSQVTYVYDAVEKPLEWFFDNGYLDECYRKDSPYEVMRLHHIRASYVRVYSKSNLHSQEKIS